MCETRRFFEAVCDIVALDGRLTLCYCLEVAQDALCQFEIDCERCEPYRDTARRFSDWSQPHGLLSHIVE